MRDINTIQNTLKSQELGALNFGESSYTNTQNKSQPMFIMDRDAFSLLVFGFNGPKALTFKMDFIKTFNSMELEIMKAKAGEMRVQGKRIYSVVYQQHRSISSRRQK